MRLVDDSSSEDHEQKISSNTSRSDGLTLNGEEAYLVREIRGDRISRKRKEYLVLWEGYSSSEASWVPASDVNLFARRLYLAKKRKMD